MVKCFSCFFRAALFVLFLALPGLASAAPEAGRELRLITLGAPAVEIVCALGLEHRLAARSSWDSFPPSIQALPDIGTPYQPSLERILSLKPDLILLDSRLGTLPEQMRACGVEVLPVNAYNPAEVIPAVEALAKRLGVERRGDELAAELSALRDFVRERLAGLPEQERKGGFMLTSAADLFCVAPESGCTLLEEAGARNLAAGRGSPFPLLSLERLAAAKPDFLLVPTKAGQAVRQKAAFERRIRSVLPEACRAIPLEEGHTFGLRSFLGMLELAAELYPARITPEEAQRRKSAFLEAFFPSAVQGGRP